VSAGGKVIVRLIPALAAGQMELAGIFLSCTEEQTVFYWVAVCLYSCGLILVKLEVLLIFRPNLYFYYLYWVSIKIFFFSFR
jgi:hypothetical protein